MSWVGAVIEVVSTLETFAQLNRAATVVRDLLARLPVALLVREG